MKDSEIQVAGISIQVVRKKIKHLHLYVKPPDGHVLVTAPARMADATILRAVEQKEQWLVQHVQKYKNQPLPSPIAYKNGEIHKLWGKPYTLTLCYGAPNHVVVQDPFLVLTVRQGSTVEQREKVLREWYRTQLKQAIAERLPIWEAHTGLHATAWQIKVMKTRWGTCNTRTGKLWFSLMLAQKPEACLDYVILHELLHRIEPHHNAHFYALLDQYMPIWRNYKAMLRE